MKKISKSQLKPNILKIFRQIEESGETIIVTDHGKPVLKIIPYRERENQKLNDLKGTVLKYNKPEEPVGLDDWDILK